MADELILRLKVESEDADKKLQDTDKQVKKIKDSSDETNKGLGVADTKVGKMWNSFKAGAQKGIASMKTLKGAIAATGIGLLVIAIISLTKYFTGTARGAEQLKVVFAALGQVLTVVTDTLIKIGEALVKVGKVIGSVIKGNKTLKEGFVEVKEIGKDAVDGIAESYRNLNTTVKEAMVLAERENQLRRDRMTNLVEEAKLNVEIAKLKERIDDATLTEIERIGLLNQAQEKQNQLYDERVRVAREDYEIKSAQNKLGESTLEDMEEEAQLLANLINVEADRANAQKKITAKRSALLLSQQAKVQANADAEIKASQDVQDALDAALKKEEERLNKQLELQAANDEKQLQDTIMLEDRLAALRLEGQEREEEALRQWLENQLIIYAENEDAKALIREEAGIKRLEIQDKYNEQAYNEQQAADAVANKLAEDKEAEQFAIKMAGVSNLQAIGSILQELAGENKKLAIAGLVVEQAAGLAQIAVNTSIGASKALAQFGPIAGAIFAALTVAAGVASAALVVSNTKKGIAEINAAPVKAKGGWLSGPSHANGGILLANGDEVEGGEYVVNKNTMSNPTYAAEIQRLNAAGNGGSTTASQGITMDEAVALIKEAQSIPVVVTENSISTAQKNVVVRQDRFTV